MRHAVQSPKRLRFNGSYSEPSALGDAARAGYYHYHFLPGKGLETPQITRFGGFFVIEPRQLQMDLLDRHGKIAVFSLKNVAESLSLITRKI